MTTVAPTKICFFIETAENAKDATERRNFIYDSNRFIFRFMACLGQTPITRNNQGKIELKFSNAWTVGTICTAVLIASSGLFTGYLILWNLLHKPMSFEMAMFHLTMLAIPFLEMVSFVSLYEMKKFAVYLMSWDLFQDRFKEVTGTTIEPIRYLNPVFLTVSMIAAVAMSARLLLSDAYGMIGSLFSYNHFIRVIIVSHAVPISLILGGYCYVWAMLTTSVGYAADCLLTQLSKKLVSGPMTSQQAEDMTELYLLLRGQCMGLGECLGLTFLYISAFKFMVAMPSVYFGVKHLVNGGDASPLLYACTSVVFISVYTEYAHKAVNKAGRCLEDKLTELLRNGDARTNRQHLLRFVQTVISARPHLSLLGFFKMDRSVNISLYSSLITFIIVIVQFGKD